MSLSKVKRQVGRMRLDEIELLVKHCKKQMPITRRKENKVRNDDAWGWVKTLKPGDEIWSNAECINQHHQFVQHKLTVRAIQPRKKILLVACNTRVHAFALSEIIRYKLQSTVRTVVGR